MPYRAPGVADPRQAWILAEIDRAQQTLDQSILEAQALPDADLSKTHRLNRYRQLKREVNTSFDSLDASTRIWAERDIPDLYRGGWFVGATQTGHGFDFTLPHREAIDILSYDAYDDVATRLQQVSQGFADTVDLQEMYEGMSVEDMAMIQGKSRSQIAQALLTGEADPNKVARLLAQDLWQDNPNLKIVDSGGNRWQMKNYTRMLVRTKSANAYSSGSLNKYAEEGVKRVQVFDGTEDEACAEANGQVWSLRYAMNHVIAHPNCVRAFAAKSGSGDVNRDDDSSFLALGDRAELAVGSIAALRYFNRTGEVNTSSTLARLLFETFEAGTVPLPLIDSFVSGFFHLGLREVDKWIEEYIDPVLYAAGLIRNAPTARELKRIRKPEEMLERVAKWITAANQEAFGTDYHPQVRAITDTLSRSTGYVENIVMVNKVRGRDFALGLSFVPAVTAEIIDMNRFGKITSEVLVRVITGDDTFAEAYRASDFMLNQFQDVKRLHLLSLNATHDELLVIYDDLARVNRTATMLITEQMKIGDASPLFIDFLQKYGIPLDDIGEETFATRRMAELLQDVRRSQAQVLHRIEESEGVLRQRQLAMAVSAGEDLPTHATSLWDAAKYDEAVDSMAEVIRSGRPSFDTGSFREFKDFWRMAHNSHFFAGDDSSLYDAILRGYVRTLDVAPEIGDEVVASFFKGVDVTDPAEVFAMWNKMVQSIGLDTQGRLTLGYADKVGKVVIDEVVGGWMARVLDLVDTRFFVKEDKLWRRWVREETPLANWLTRRIGAVAGTQVDGHAVHMLWAKLSDDVISGVGAEGAGVSHSNFHSWLINTYGDANVHVLGHGGVNGTNYAVWDEVADSQIFIKKLNSSAGHVAQSDAATSYGLTNWVAKELKDVVAVPPTRTISLTNDETIAVMPYIDDAEAWFVMEASDIPYESARKTYVFDLLTGESDNHLGNVMLDYYSNGEIVIDREMSFGIHTRGNSFDVFQKDGPMLTMADIMGRHWEDGIDTGSRVDRPVQLRRLTEAEFEVLTKRTEFEVLKENKFGNETFTLFDIDGHGFPLTALEGTRLVVTEAEQELMDVAIPFGRFGWYMSHGQIQYAPSISPTDTELAFIQKILHGDPDELRAEITAVIEGSLQDITEGSVIRTQLSNIWEAHEWPSEVPGSGGMADYVLTFMQARISKYVDGGIINLSGTKIEHVNKSGDVFRIGDAVTIKHADGREFKGTVMNITETTTGDTRIHWLDSVGHRLSVDTMNASPEGPLVFDPDDWQIFRRPSDELRDKVDLADEVLAKIPNVRVVDEVELEPLRRIAVIADDAGLPIGRQQESVVIDWAGSADDAIRVVSNEGDVVSVPAVRAIDDMMPTIESELAKIAPEYRPSKVVIHLNVMETTDGKLAFGYFDPDTREIHTTLAEILDLPIERPGGIEALVLPNGVRPDRAMFRNLDKEPFRQVLQHEVGHSVKVTIEATQRQVVTTDVTKQLARAYPDAIDRTDLNQIARTLLPQDLDISRYADEFDALVHIRTDLIMDVINTNEIEEMKSLFAKATKIPEWIDRAYAGLLSNDLDAHHEVFADIYRRVAQYGGGYKAYRAVAEELGVDPSDISRLFNANVVEFPDINTYDSLDWQIWLKQVLHENATEIVPMDSSSRLYRKLGIDLDALTEAAGEGFTIGLDGTSPTSGYSVALRQFEEVIETRDKAEAREVLKSYIARHRKILKENPELRIGGWRDSDGKLYLDVSRQFDDRVDAANFGFVEHQRSMYGFDEDGVIDLMDDAPDFTTWMSRHSPDDPFEEYLAKERRVGAAFTKQNKTVDGVQQQLRRELLDDTGEFFPISLDAFDETQQRKLIDSLSAYYREPTDAELEELQGLSLTALRERARKEGVRGYSKLKRDELIQQVGFQIANPEPLTQDLIKRRLTHILETFEELNETVGPERLLNESTGQEFQDLRGKYRFYTTWRNELVQDSIDTGIPAPAIIAAAARMSAGLDADANLWIARFMARMVGEDGGLGHVLSTKEAREIRKWLGVSLDDKDGQAYRYLKEFKKPERADGFVEMAASIKAGRRLNQYDEVTGAYIMHVLTVMNSQGLGPTGKGYSFATRYGFPQFQMSLGSMQGRRTIHEVVGDSKVRSFYNNILDPENIAGVGDVTVDFHMTDMANWGIGKPKATYKGDEPRILGIGAGLRPIIGDTVRELFDEGWGTRLGADTPAELQEILWGMWRDGKDWDLWGELRRIDKK